MNNKTTEKTLALQGDTSQRDDRYTKGSSQRLDPETNRELLRIANDNFLTLKNDWSKVMAIYDRKHLNR